jgi:hypothetical protein
MAHLLRDEPLVLLAGHGVPSSAGLGPEGFAVEAGHGGEVVGCLELFDPNLIEALQVVEGLLRSPEALAVLLEAAGQVALERAGAILDERIQK